MKKLTLVEYQNEVLKVYEYLNSILKKNNVKCWAHSGTLLGIIRHNDEFIPWDDDLDVMVSYKEFSENWKKISDEINKPSSDFYIINYDTNEDNLYSNINFARIFMKKKLDIEFQWRDYKNRPFVDIFFSGPSNTFNTEKKWYKYDRYSRMSWIVEKGFNRYPRFQNNKKLIFKKNLKTIGAKLVYHRWWMNRYLAKPRNLDNGDWTKLRRIDAWSKRKVIYDTEKFIIRKIRGVDILVSNNWEDEILNTFGPNWKDYKIKKPHFANKRSKLHKRNIQSDKFLDSKYVNED